MLSDVFTINPAATGTSSYKLTLTNLNFKIDTTSVLSHSFITVETSDGSTNTVVGEVELETISVADVHTESTSGVKVHLFDIGAGTLTLKSVTVSGFTINTNA